MIALIDKDGKVAFLLSDTADLSQYPIVTDRATFEISNLDSPTIIHGAPNAPIGALEYDGFSVVEKPHVENKPEVPFSVTRRQGLQQLRIEGFTEAQIESMIAALPVPDLAKDLALIEFKTSQVFERNRPLVNQLGAMIGKDAAGIDAMFIAAAKL